MSKKHKTRQDKIIADLRRKLETTKAVKWEVGSGKSFDSELRIVELLDNEVRSKKKEIEKSNLPFPSPTSHFSPPTSISHLRKDLTKTFILAILAISLEIVLYFTLG